MEKIGINIGSFKTLIHTTSYNVKLLGDESGSRTITTAIELSSPLRKFGNGCQVTTPDEEILFRENFMEKILEKENSELLFMFAKYLKRVIEGHNSLCKNVFLTVPFYYKEEERIRISEIFINAGHNVNGIFTDTTAASIGYFYTKNITKKLLVLDFGHSKTTASIFDVTPQKIVAEKHSGIKVGGKNFDKKIAEFLTKNVEENKNFVKSRLLKEMLKFKSGLNNTTTFKRKVDLMGNQTLFVLEEKDYLNLISEDLKEIQTFLKSIKDWKYDIVEVIGGNKHNKHVSDILEHNFDNISYSMVYDEAVSYGAAVGGALVNLVTKSAYDTISEKIFVKINNSEEEENNFKFESLQFPSKKEIMVKSSEETTTVDIFENDVKIGEFEYKNEGNNFVIELNFNLKKSVIPKIKYLMKEDKDSKELIKEEVKTDIEYFNNEMTDKEIEEMKLPEEKFRKIEVEQIEIGNLRNKLENNINKFVQKLRDPVYEFEESEISDLQRKLGEFEYLMPSNSLEEENKVFQKMLSTIDLGLEKMKNLFESKKENLREKVMNLRTFVVQNERYTVSKNKLQVMLFKLESLLKEEFSLSTDYDFDEKFSFDDIQVKNTIKSHFKTIEEEDIKKKKEEELLEKMNKEKESKKSEKVDENNKSNEVDENNNSELKSEEKSEEKTEKKSEEKSE